MPCVGINIIFQTAELLKTPYQLSESQSRQVCSFPCPYFPPVKGKSDGFVSGNVEVFSIENTLFSALNKNECLLIAPR